jgi:formylglycine-generating enzyme required for sulfatase activity
MTEETIFASALEKPPAERSAYLADACGGDESLRKRLEALLAASEKVGNFMANPAVGPAVDPSATEALSASAAERDATATNPDDEGLSFLTPSARPDSLGRIGHYEVLEVLGKGGFGIVFRAFDERLQRVVALKLMAPQLATTSPARKRFLREARSSAQVRHENVVQVYEVAEQPLPYLAMEFIPGETLQQKLDRVGPLDVPETLRIGRQIAEGLAAAHATDLIHRDIKPGNVLIDGGQQRVKITDFGLARAADDASISQSGIIAGTPMYMAPEQALGQTLDQRADLFSLGSVLYQMVAGRPPFRANTAVAVLKRVAEDKPRDIREIIPETPQWMCDIIAKLHAKDPDDRYLSAREVADVLADCEAQLKAHSKLKDYSRIPRSKPQRSGRRKWVAVAAVVVLLPVIALAVTEFAGVTHLFQGQPGTSDASKSGSDPQAKARAGWNDWPADAPPPAMAPFDAAQARAHQEAWAKYLGLPVEFTNNIGMKLRFIPPGKFTMGSSQEEIDFWLKQKVDDWIKKLLPAEGPQHDIEITQPFYVGQTEVTVGQFRQFVKATGFKTQAEREGGAYRHTLDGKWEIDAKTNWLTPGFSQTDDNPVTCVSWNDAVEFCNWLNTQEASEAASAPRGTYRLLTEAEWEYSCRAGSRGRWFCGENNGELLTYARIGDNSELHTWPVAGLKANAWGLHDMHGNVSEWCQDVYDANYYKTSPPKDPTGPGAGGDRMIRGGSYLHASDYCPSALRGGMEPNWQCDDLGFRVVLAVSPPAGARIAAQARAHQEAWAKYLGVQAESTNTLGMKLRLIPPGKFMMGSSQEEIDFWLKQNDDDWARKRLPGEGPQHEVEITQPFCIGQTEVTVGQFRQFVSARRYRTQAEREGSGLRRFPDGAWKMDPKTNWLNPGFDQTEDHPAVCISWNDAVEFCKWLSKKEGKTYRLPTEAEWEYSCRAGSKGRWSFGDNQDQLLHYARIGGNSQRHTWPVGGKKENAWGLHDMNGNAWEWCQDFFGANYYQTGPPKDPPGPGAGDECVLRGASYDNTPMDCRSAFRDHADPSQCNTNFGFRVVLAVSLPAGDRTKSAAKEKASLAIAPFTDADRRAAEYVLSIGGTVRIDGNDKDIGAHGQLPTGTFQLTYVFLHENNQVTDSGLAAFKGCKHLISLDISYTRVSDEGLEHFKDCTDLTGLFLHGTKVTDAGLAHFKDWKNLLAINLNDTRVTDAGLIHLKGCKRLNWLALASTKLSDAGLVRVSDCKNLTFLGLGDTQVTDAGLASIKGLPLKKVEIWDTRITDLTLLRGMPLEEITLTPKNITRGLDILRDMKILKTIGIYWTQAWPAAEFWERFDNGEFK